MPGTEKITNVELMTFLYPRPTRSDPRSRVPARVSTRCHSTNVTTETKIHRSAPGPPCPRQSGLAAHTKWTVTKTHAQDDEVGDHEYAAVTALPLNPCLAGFGTHQPPRAPDVPERTCPLPDSRPRRPPDDAPPGGGCRPSQNEGHRYRDDSQPERDPTVAVGREECVLAADPWLSAMHRRGARPTTAVMANATRTRPAVIGV